MNTIIGASVNLASRLEHAAAAGGILISYETYAHVKGKVRCNKHGEIQLKGIADPVATYEVIEFPSGTNAITSINTMIVLRIG